MHLSFYHCHTRYPSQFNFRASKVVWNRLLLAIRPPYPTFVFLFVYVSLSFLCASNNVFIYISIYLRKHLILKWKIKKTKKNGAHWRDMFSSGVR